MIVGYAPSSCLKGSAITLVAAPDEVPGCPSNYIVSEQELSMIRLGGVPYVKGRNVLSSEVVLFARLTEPIIAHVRFLAVGYKPTNGEEAHEQWSGTVIDC